MKAEIEDFIYTDTTDVFARRCGECGSSQFEDTGSRIYCVRCGLVDEDKREINRRIFNTDGN